jgi:hypothetical protein
VTALNIIRQDGGAATYLLTDTAQFRPNGTIDKFARKVHPVRVGGRVRGAFAVTGSSAFAPLLRAELRRLQARTVEALLASVPAAFSEASTKLDALAVLWGWEPCGAAVAIAMFDPEDGRATAHLIADEGTVRSLFFRSGFEPFALEPVRRVLSCYGRSPFRATVDVCDPLEWNPARDAAALIQAQRVEGTIVDGCERSVVGGDAVVTRIDASGVHSQVVLRWPDRVGEMVDVRAVGRTPCPPLHAAKWLILRGLGMAGAVSPTTAPAQ